MNVECFAGYEEGPEQCKGYIVASGCSLPTKTPFDNIYTMLDTVREIGYPVDIEKLRCVK